MNRLDVVAVEVADEDRVVARVVLGEDPRGVEDLRPGVERGLVDGVDLVGAQRTEGDVELARLVSTGRTDPEGGEAPPSRDPDRQPRAAGKN